MTLLFLMNIIAAFSFPVHLTPTEVDFYYKGTNEWQCFSVSQIKKLECEEWKSFLGRWEEHSDLNLVVEADTQVHEYGFKTPFSVCNEFKKDFLDLLKNQKYFCIYGTPLQLLDFEPKNHGKPTMSWIYECFKTNLGQVAWSGGFGSCVDD